MNRQSHQYMPKDMQIPRGAVQQSRVQQVAVPPAAQTAAQGMPPGVNQPQHDGGDDKKKRHRGVGFYIAIVIAVLALAAAVFFAWNWWDSQQSKGRDSNALIGQVEGKTTEEIQAELDQMVSEGMFRISIASEVVMESGSAEAPLKIENVPGNRYLMQVDITRNDTGERIYESGIIEPNHYIQSARLDQVLPAGTYTCTALFHALDPETEDEIGTAAAELSIVVER